MAKTLKHSISYTEIQRLHDWYLSSARDLPWRKNFDPYPVWLSEVMLQQTQVKTVIPYFEKFLSQFPTIHDLAHADEETVFRLWAGLGYYSRARNLHRAAKVLSETFHQFGTIPSSEAFWRALPGVGPYTAGAIRSIVYEETAPIVDGNVVRVFSRFFGIPNRTPGDPVIWECSKNFISSRKKLSPRILNSALMELGATVCTPKSPKCESCPLRKKCVGQKNPLKYPEPKVRAKVKLLTEERHVWFLKKGDTFRFYLEKSEGWRKGLWDFPMSPPVSGKLIRLWDQKTVVTNHQITRKLKLWQVTRSASPADAKGRWFGRDDLPGLAAPARKVIQGLDFDTL